MRCNIKMYWKRQALKKNALLYRRFLELQGKPIGLTFYDDTYKKAREGVLVQDYVAQLREKYNVGVVVQDYGKLMYITNPS